MSNTITYSPDYTVAPGEIIKEYLNFLSMTQVDLAEKTGLAITTINGVIKGTLPISSEIALELEKNLQRPAHFWTNLEHQYQVDKTRVHNAEKHQKPPPLGVPFMMPVRVVLDTNCREKNLSPRP